MTTKLKERETRFSGICKVSRGLLLTPRELGDRERAPTCGLNGRAVSNNVRTYVGAVGRFGPGGPALPANISWPDRESSQSAKSAFWVPVMMVIDLGLNSREKRAFLVKIATCLSKKTR